MHDSGLLGLEPRSSPSKGDVLPLDDGPLKLKVFTVQILAALFDKYARR